MPAYRTVAGYYASLCSVAMEFGFYNCEPLRALPENQEYLNRPVVPGDIVYIPDRVDSEFSKPVDNRHNFTVKAALPPSIRIVKGVGFNPDQDFERNSIPVSNYVTTKQGTNTGNSFPTGYDYVPSVDPDAFRVEVYDPAASGTVNVKLEALKPGYLDTWGKPTPNKWEPSTVAGGSIAAAPCQANTGRFSHHFISKYFRLVVDEADLNASGLSNQLLLVSDYATGAGDESASSPDSIEILHHQVRATYQLPRCTGNPKCALTTLLPVVDPSYIRRFKVQFFLFQDWAAHAETTSLGVTAETGRQNLRRRIYKWCRRAFAQVGLTPDFQDSDIHSVVPPGENMLCLSHGHGRPVAPAGAQLNFGLIRGNQPEPNPVQVVFQGGETAVEAAEVISNALPEGVTARIFPCPPTPNGEPACDLVLYDTTFGAYPARIIDVQLSQGAGLTVDVPRVNLQSVIVDDDSRDTSRLRLSPDLKRILRCRGEWPYGLEPNVISVIVVEGFNTPSVQGLAFPECQNAPAAECPREDLHSVIVIPANCAAGATLDGGDNLPFALPGLIAQILGDMRLDPSDPYAANSLLNPASSAANSITATKRLPDEPYGTKYFPGGSARSQRGRMSDRLRDAGANKLSSW